MPRPSTVETLPADILEQLQALLRDPRVSQLEATAQINAILEEQGHPDRVSKSAVNRYDLRMREVGDRLRQSREVANMWIGKMGATPQGQMGNLVNEILRTLSFELSMKLTEGELNEDEMPGIIKMLKELSLSTMRLERAASENVKREKEIREQERKAAAETAAKIAKSGGMSKQTIEELKASILGVKRGS